MLAGEGGIQESERSSVKKKKVEGCLKCTNSLQYSAEHFTVPKSLLM